MASQVTYQSNMLNQNVNLEKIINLLGAHKPMSIKPLFLTHIKNVNIFIKNMQMAMTQIAKNQQHNTT